jgi:hypothetical protein
MKDCASQVERHLKEFAGKICGAFHGKYQSAFEREDRLEKEAYFQLNPIPLLNWKKTGATLLTLGIENTGVDSLLHCGSENPFSAYVYSPYRANKAVTDNSTDQIVSIVPPPPEFEATFDNPNRGYVFQKIPPPISPADFCDSKKLEKHLVDPLAALVAWFNTNEKAIIKAFALTSGARK